MRGVFMDSRKIIIALAIHHKGEWHAINEAILKKDYVPEDVAEVYLKSLKCNAITILDQEYPKYLRETFCPPYVLFYYGDISLISDRTKNVAVVGSRKVSKEGKENIDYIVSGICKRYNVVSGLALGIDTAAHKSALSNGGKTIAVLANGIEYCYPSENEEVYKTIKKNHLVISEYFGFISPKPIHFHQRNRLIVAFSRGTIIGESKRYSGTLITANYTLAVHNDIMAIPSNDIHDSLNNLIIKEGCPVVLSPDDVFEIFDEL